MDGANAQLLFTTNGDASAWVGIGGYGWPTGGTSGTLLQTGVTVRCANGSPQYVGWWEEYPSVPNIPRVFAQGSTAGLSYGAATPLNGSSKIPGEPPVPFADYGTVNFTNLKTSLQTWTLTASEGIAIMQNGAILSTPSLPAIDDFSVNYTG